ncbi:MAG: phosphopantetheine adenylyltransferase [Methanomicrobiales archaeon]|nr:phosphopantetheine adenylyltransferase [Methanomicrobiales archaeon]
MKVMVGGTFDPVHDGHKKLLERAFALAGPSGEVVIGLTTDSFAGKKTHPVRSFKERNHNLTAYLDGCRYAAKWTIAPLDDPFGPAVTEDFDALVVSEETIPGALEINKRRKQQGKRKVDIHQIACVLADDGKWISSTRILSGEIDDHGRIISA